MNRPAYSSILYSDTLLRHLKDHSEHSPDGMPEGRRHSSNTTEYDAPQSTFSANAANASPVEAYQNNPSSNPLGNGMDISLDAFDFDFEAQFPSWIMDGDLQNGILDTPLGGYNGRTATWMGRKPLCYTWVYQQLQACF